MNSGEITVIIPAKNEEAGLKLFLDDLRQQLPDAEIIVVNDGSTDGTERICKEHSVRTISHPYSMGNGAAVKSGVRAARGEKLVLMDADGQHAPADIPKLLALLDSGYDMAVGARTHASQANVGRSLANKIYSWFASWMVGQRIGDLTSGLRAARTAKFREFLHLLPNGFSYPTTITMCFFRAGYGVGYVPIHAGRRLGKSHIRPMKDGMRFLFIIFRIGTLYSPLKIFLPISFLFFITGLGYYAYTYIMAERFTNMSGLLFTTSVLIFLIGLVSEQITNLLFSPRHDR